MSLVILGIRYLGATLAIMTSTSIKSFRALFRSSSACETGPLELRTAEAPAVVPGSALLQILYAWIPQYASEILDNSTSSQRGKFNHSARPTIVGFTAVARVLAIPIDAAVLKVGDLVIMEPTVQARDDPNNSKFLQGWYSGATPTTQRLSEEVWPTAAFAEIMLAPLENVHKVDERALRKFDMTPADLAFFGQMSTAYGGLRSIDVRAGETVLIAPATGTFGGAAVRVALAMGARVIAAGRQKEVLEELVALDDRVSAFQLGSDGTLDWQGLIDTHGEVDIFVDFTPAAAAGSELTKSGMMAVKSGGRVVLVGGVPGDVPFPYGVALWKGLTIKGSMMCPREYVVELVKLIETGMLRLGPHSGMRSHGLFDLHEWKVALETAKVESGQGRGTFFAPRADSAVL